MPWEWCKIWTNLIIHDSVSNVFRKFAYSTYICLILLVLGPTGQLQNAAQFILDSFKGSVKGLK